MDRRTVHRPGGTGIPDRSNIMNTTYIIWADGAEDQAQELILPETAPYDVEFAAHKLGCEVEAVNMCSVGEMDHYGVSLAD